MNSSTWFFSHKNPLFLQESFLEQEMEEPFGFMRVFIFLGGVLLFGFETGSFYATQAGLQLMILLPQLPSIGITVMYHHACLLKVC
jgi:hypothetical protein